MFKNKQRIYWYLQLFGWLAYIILAGILYKVTGKELNKDLIGTLAAAYIGGIGSSHLYRMAIKQWGWAKFGILKLIPRVILGSAVFAIIFEISFYVLSSLLIDGSFNWSMVDVFTEWLNWSILFLFWSLIYFSFHFFERYKDEEIKNLRWEASKNEIELNKLKSQLNPHFIFNSMNIIRALIDEDPNKAKKSITQLSHILRKTLQMGERRTVSLDEELKVVMDYIALEKARFEERLQCESHIDPKSGSFQVPALMVQTLVENGIKHGVSQLPEGGLLSLTTRIENDELHILITNSGQIKAANSKDPGFGLLNTKQRLQLLYGNAAKLELYNRDTETVVTEVTIPRLQN